MTTIKTIIIVATIKNWNIYDLDVNNTLFNGDLHEDLYLKPHLGLLHE